MSQSKRSVAVIGLGACGLVAAKNLLEADFDVTAFDRNDYIGGLWQFTDDADKLSVLKTTISNTSRQNSCFTDYPYPPNASQFPPASEVAQYLNSYADHFDLRPHLRFSTKIEHISRSGDGWLLDTRDVKTEKPTSLYFDKVVLCVGSTVQQAKWPKIPGLDSATAQVMHSNAYKSPIPFRGKRVVVVGLGNSGTDIACDLVGHASDVWLSHRSGNAILPRKLVDGKPLDHVMTMRFFTIQGFMMSWLPFLAPSLSAIAMARIQKQSFKIKPEWKLGPVPSSVRKNPVVNDELIPTLEAEKLKLASGLTAIKGNQLTFADGSILEGVDVVIFATGFRSDYSILDASVDPTRNSRQDWIELPGSDDRPLPRLYQGMFSLDHPDSLAFLGSMPMAPQANLSLDLSSCALAQIWAGKSKLPSKKEMALHVDTQHELVCQLASTGALYDTNFRNGYDWFVWCDEAAGLGLVKRLGFGLEAWRFWWEHKDIYSLIMNGIRSPHLFRIFDEGKRKPWEQALSMAQAGNAESVKLQER